MGLGVVTQVPGGGSAGSGHGVGRESCGGRVASHTDTARKQRYSGTSDLVYDLITPRLQVLAGALKDNGRGVVVGESTFGKGLIQTVVDLSDGSGLAVTVAKYQTPAGEGGWGRGGGG